MPEWISIDERLPDDDRQVLCWYLSGSGEYSYTVGSYLHMKHGCLWDTHIDGNECCYGCAKVTHWMPLPLPPKEKAEE